MHHKVDGFENRVPCKVGTILTVDVHAPMTAFEASCDGGDDVPRLRRRRRRLPPVASTIHHHPPPRRVPMTLAAMTTKILIMQ